MIQMAAAVVAHGRANGFRHVADPCEQFLDRKLLKLGMALESLVRLLTYAPWCLSW